MSIQNRGHSLPPSVTSAHSPAETTNTRHNMSSDHPRPEEMHHGYGETTEQHLAHSSSDAPPHFGLPFGREERLFYILAAPSWAFEIVAGIIGSYFSSSHPAFIALVTIFLVLHWAAWLQTVVGMMQRASWVRDESNLPDRRRYLHLAVRLNRLMLVGVVLPHPKSRLLTINTAHLRSRARHLHRSVRTPEQHRRPG